MVGAISSDYCLWSLGQPAEDGKVLEFEILGPLLIRGESGDIAIQGARRRALLIRLLVSANQLVPAGLLIEDIWDQDPPAGASQTLQSHLSFLRKTLGRDRIRHSAGGYALVCEDGEVDYRQFEFEHNLGIKAHAGGDFVTAARELEMGLARWHGSPLMDVNTATWALPEIARLEEMQVAAREVWIDSLLSLGRPTEAATHAASAVAEHGLRERFWAQLMLALYRSGRQADALRAYQRLRVQFGEDLGIEPSADLVALDEAIVLQKPELDWKEPAKRQLAGSPDVATEQSSRANELVPLPPRLLLESATLFIGRQPELQQLEGSWKQVEEGNSRVIMLGGEPGIGKTSLAAAIAVRASGRGGMVLYGRCDEDLGIPYQPWVEAFGHLLRHGPDSLLDNHVPTRVAELARLLPEFDGAHRCSGF